MVGKIIGQIIFARKPSDRACVLIQGLAGIERGESVFALSGFSPMPTLGFGDSGAGTLRERAQVFWAHGHSLHQRQRSA